MKAYCNIEADLTQEDFDILVESFNIDPTQDITKQKTKVANMLKRVFEKQMEEAINSISKLEVRID